MASVITFLSFLSSKKQIFIHTFSLLLLGILPDMKRHSRTNADTQFFPNFQAVKIKHFPVLFPPTGFLFLNVALHVLLSVLLWGNTRCQENSNPHFPTQNKDICCTFLEPWKSNGRLASQYFSSHFWAQCFNNVFTKSAMFPILRQMDPIHIQVPNFLNIRFKVSPRLPQCLPSGYTDRTVPKSGNH